MAKTQVGASVEIEFKSVGEMRKAIKEATSDLIVMQEQFGKTSPQAIAAAQRIAQLKDRIQDAKEQADLFDPGKKFQAFANAASTVASGFAAVQGAMALVGEESEDLQKTLVKVQGAMALAQG
jgi:predicted  nucleic acid-binding Zn-ribbon protein